MWKFQNFWLIQILREINLGNLEVLLEVIYFFTVWKFENFSVATLSFRFYVKSILDNLEVVEPPFLPFLSGIQIQILREINFGEFRSSKIAIFALFGL